MLFRSGSCGVLCRLCGVLLRCRGRRGSELSNEVQIFSTTSGRWQTPEMLDDVAPCPRYGACLAARNSQVGICLAPCSARLGRAGRAQGHGPGAGNDAANDAVHHWRDGEGLPASRLQ